MMIVYQRDYGYELWQVLCAEVQGAGQSRELSCKVQRTHMLDVRILGVANLVCLVFSSSSSSRGASCEARLRF